MASLNPITFGKYLPENALYMAVLANNISEAQRLLAEGADANVCVKNFGSALNLAVTRGQIEIVEVLLEYGANPNQKVSFSFMPLHIAVCENNFELSKMLLDHGANAKDGMIHIAIQNSNLDILKLLLEKGVDPNFGTSFNNSPLYAALNCSSPDVLMDIVKALLEAGADVNAANLFGQTALHVASCPDIVVCLLENGAQINAQDNEGRTPLHLTVVSIIEIYQNKKVIEPLLFAGANVDIPDDYGRTFITMYNDIKNECSDIDVMMEKFRILNIKSDITRRFDDVPSRKTQELTAELDSLKKTNVEGISLYSVFEQGLEDFVYGNDSTFRKTIQGDDFKKMFPHFYLLTRLFFREAERNYFLKQLSETFSYKLSEVLQLNVPTDVGYLVIGLLDQRDMNNLKLALQ